MSNTGTNYGWADLLPRLVEAEPRTLLDALRTFVPDAGREQVDAWHFEADAWRLRPGTRARGLVRDPFRLRLNAYRVLLTRGREGLVLFVPPDPILDATHAALTRAGARDARQDAARSVA